MPSLENRGATEGWNSGVPPVVPARVIPFDGLSAAAKVAAARLGVAAPARTMPGWAVSRAAGGSSGSGSGGDTNATPGSGWAGGSGCDAGRAVAAASRSGAGSMTGSSLG